MSDLKEYYPNSIEDMPLSPEVNETSYEDTTKDISSVQKISTVNRYQMPDPMLAKELVNASLDTLTKRILSDYQFSETGSIQIGKYVNGTSGDIRLSPTGILGRNSAGTTTFSIDGTTGDATFKGTVLAGSLVTGSATVQGQGAFIVNDGTYNVIHIGYLAGGY